MSLSHDRSAVERCLSPAPAPLDLQKLEEQEQRARQLKEKLRSKQRSLRQQLEQLRGLGTVGERERLRADSLDSSGLSSERSDSDQGKCPGVEGSGGMSGPGLLTGPLPVQRSWRWTWRAWCLEVRLSCCGASAQARSTATHTAAVPGCDPHRPERPLPSAHSLRRQARALTGPPGLLGVTVGMDSKDPVWEQVLLVPCCWRLAVPPGRGMLGPPSPAGQVAWAQAPLPGIFFIALGPAVHGSRKPLGPSCSFLNKGPWPLPHAYCIFIKSLFLNFLCMVLPDENVGTSSYKLEKKK